MQNMLHWSESPDVDSGINLLLAAYFFLYIYIFMCLKIPVTSGSSINCLDTELRIENGCTNPDLDTNCTKRDKPTNSPLL